MSILDNLSQIEELDQQNVRGSIAALPKQCEQAFQEVSKVKVPKKYRVVKNVVVNGMGGSALGAHIIQSLFQDELTVPLQIVKEYTVPRYVSRDTLYILSSYSGTTKEVLATRYEALARGAKVMGITSGGVLAHFLKQKKLPAYIFRPHFNPCGQPRMGLGYSILGQILLFRQAGLLKISNVQIKSLIAFLKKDYLRFNPEVKTPRNPAKKVAQVLRGKIPIIVAAEFLQGNAHTLQNQCNENAKNFAAHHFISEMSHHLMEGLSFPQTNSRQLVFFFLNSNFYSSKIQKYFQVTKKVLHRRKIANFEFQATAANKFLQSFEVLQFGSYLSFYLAMLNKVNPSPVPWVDYFKKELVKA